MPHERARLPCCITNRYHKPSDEYDVGLALANESTWPNWRDGSEFRAIRDKSRAAATR
jgi:hypothetical protein